MDTTASPSPADRVYQAWWQDGSIDLFAGLTLCGISVAWLLDGVVFGAAMPALGVPLWQAFRRRVVEPRLGHVQFAASRRERLRRGQLAMIAAGGAALLAILCTGLFAPGALPLTAPELAPALPAALVGSAALLSAAMFQRARLALYAIPLVLAGGLVAWRDAEPGWALLAGGITVSLAGALLLVRFLRAFPVLPTELD